MGSKVIDYRALFQRAFTGYTTSFEQSPALLDTKEVDEIAELLRKIREEKYGVANVQRALDDLGSDEKKLEKRSIYLSGLWRVRQTDAEAALHALSSVGGAGTAADDPAEAERRRRRDEDLFGDIPEDANPDPLSPENVRARSALPQLEVLAKGSEDLARRIQEVNERRAKLEIQLEGLPKVVETFTALSQPAFEESRRHAGSLSEVLQQVRVIAKWRRRIFSVAVATGAIGLVLTVAKLLVSDATDANTIIILVGKLKLHWVAWLIAGVGLVAQYFGASWLKEKAIKNAEASTASEVVGYYIRRALLRQSIRLHETNLEAMKEIVSAGTTIADQIGSTK